MPKRELSPDSREREQRPFQQQKSVSDIIGPMMNQQCLLNTVSNPNSYQSLDSLPRTEGSTMSPTRNAESSAECETSATPEESASATDTADVQLGEPDTTDVDGLRDVAKATRRAVVKAGKSVKNELGDVIEGAAKIVAEEFEDTVNGGLDVFSVALNGTVETVGSCLRQQHSLEDTPGNNVYITNPSEEATNRIIPMGMHIEPVKFKNGSGQMVIVVKPGELAQQASLKENDVIIAIGETDVTQMGLNKVLTIFGTIASTFSMTVVRRVPQEGIDEPMLVKHIITVEVHVNDDNVVAIEVLNVTCEKLWYNTSTPTGYISHKPSNTATRYFMKVTNGALHMYSGKEINDNCHFKLNIYQPQCNNNPQYPCDPCTVCSVSSQKAVEIKTDTNTQAHHIILGKTDDLRGSALTADFRFFLLRRGQDWTPCQYAFESSVDSTKGYFLAVENTVLKLESYTGDVNRIGTKFRFDFSPVPS